MRGWSAILTGGASGLGLAATQEVMRGFVEVVVVSREREGGGGVRETIS